MFLLAAGGNPPLYLSMAKGIFKDIRLPVDFCGLQNKAHHLPQPGSGVLCALIIKIGHSATAGWPGGHL